MKKFLIVLSLAGFGGMMAAPSISHAAGIVVPKGDDKDKDKGKKEKKSCCAHKAAKSCSTAEKKACGDKGSKAEKTI